MSTTLFNRRSHVLLAITTRKITLQAIHTSFVNTVIDNMTVNRVLNNRPPPISGEETLLSRWQRDNSITAPFRTLKTSEFLKKWLQVVQTVEWIHRMYLTCSNAVLTPNESPVNLWDKPIKTIWEPRFYGHRQPGLTGRGHTTTWFTPTIFIASPRW